MLNKAGCPSCGSTNIQIKRENQGEIRAKNSKTVLHQTVAVCKDCGNTWYPNGKEKPRKTWLWVLGWIFIFPLPLTLILLKKKEMKPAVKYGIIAAAWILFLMIGIFGGSDRDKSPENANITPASDITEQADEKAPSAQEETEDADKTENTYANNEYYDIVETGQYTNSIGTTYLIHKILAKQDVSVSASVVATDAGGNVIGKSTDDIILTKGKNNYFCYMFDADISDASMQFQSSAEKDSFMFGERNGVEMVQYNQSGDDLYITFKQTVEKLGSFAKFKLLLYKGDTIVDTEDGYFNIYAENLNGKDTTDVASIWVYGEDFDRVEYIYEP
ncbi:MAG: hypothetical protein IJT27_05935 [Clostridia bacterium]|nr:hypothetical protein [Clostridia bacterium]